MEKMGLPAGAIRHKMMMENVDAEIIAIFFNEAPAVKPSLSGTGALTSLNTNAPSIESSGKSYEAGGAEKSFSTWRKWVYQLAIRHKMTMDRIAEKILKYSAESMQRHHKVMLRKPNMDPQKGYGSQKMEERREAMKQEGKYQKYFKMENGNTSWWNQR